MEPKSPYERIQRETVPYTFNHLVTHANGHNCQFIATLPGSLRRLTAEPDATDIDPLYLPDEKIVFTSTREPKYCHCNMHIMANLHRMDSDGANIHQISKNTLFDGHPTLLPHGQILWEP